MVRESRTTVVEEPMESIHEISIEQFSESGDIVRPSLQKRTDYKGQIIDGRDDELMGIIPVILRESKLGELMKESSKGMFRFSFVVEDNKRTYSTEIQVSIPLKDSAGGELSG